jgi:predicted transposase YbfD/YdcC
VSADRVVVSITEAFETLTEPRVERTRCHDLIDIVVIAICGTICGCDSWEDLPRYGKAKLEWLRTFLQLPNGIPSADTFARVFQRLDPSEFMNCMSSWVDALRQSVGEEIVSIDGKTMCGSGNADSGSKPLHMVRAWASQNHLVLGQQACEEKSNEITAIPKLLELIELSGAIVTIDAMGCQTGIVEKIRAKEADYVLSVKDNQPTLKKQVAEAFEGEMERAAQGELPRFRRHVTRENKHGREEERSYYVLPAPKNLRQSKRWTDVKSIGMVIRRRTVKGEEQICVHYYISSLSPNVRRFARVVRSHWSIENSLHWMLDVNFAEDQSRIRKGASPEIASMLRQLALMILKHDTQLKGSLRGKRKIAGWNNEALETLLLNFTGV